MKAFLLSIIIMSIISPVYSYVLNYSFLQDTAGASFNDEDWALFQRAQRVSLNNDRDGYRRIWKNPDTGSSGSFVPSRAKPRAGMVCRNLTIVNSSNFRVGQSTLTFCKVNGDWKGV